MHTPKIINIEKKTLIGMRQKMSLIQQLTGQLWQRFMPFRSSIENTVSEDLFSLQVYPEQYFKEFNPSLEFEKWALAEVKNAMNIPQNMEVFELEGGDYAVFEHKGMNTDTSIFGYIYNEWIPNSEYDLDDRPHFEILGARYKNNDPNSEEEIWIPIKKK